VARRFIWLLLVGITEHTHLFVLIGSVQPLPYSLPIQHQHRCIHARVTKQLFAGLARGYSDYSRREIPIGGELQLVGIALITINQRDGHILVPQATITSKCHSLYVALVSSVGVVIRIDSCTKLTWMEIFAPPIHVFLSQHLPQTINHIRVRIITTLPMRDHSSFVIEGATWYQHAGARYTHSLLVQFEQTDIRR